MLICRDGRIMCLPCFHIFLTDVNFLCVGNVYIASVSRCSYNVMSIVVLVWVPCYSD